MLIVSAQAYFYLVAANLNQTPTPMTAFLTGCTDHVISRTAALSLQPDNPLHGHTAFAAPFASFENACLDVKACCASTRPLMLWKKPGAKS
ncbi:hypothetical protein [Leeia sp.]|uniref:hypothetical protein n=1 Tax=Leeia sp. TaxID=2884678 RepID=UPI0035AFF92B